MADKTKTLYRLADGEPVKFEAVHADRILAVEKQLGFNNFSAQKPATSPIVPDNEIKRQPGDSDSDKTGAGAPNSPETGAAG